MTIGSKSGDSRITRANVGGVTAVPSSSEITIGSMPAAAMKSRADDTVSVKTESQIPPNQKQVLYESEDEYFHDFTHTSPVSPT